MWKYSRMKCTAGSSDLSPSVLKDFLDQLGDLKKRLTNIRSMDDNEPPVTPIDVTEYDSDGEETVSTLTIEEFFSKMRRKLLHLKDKTTENKRKNENRDKVILTETLKTFPRAKLIGLESRRTFLPWQTRYTQLKATLKGCGLPDWKSQLLILGQPED